MSATKRTRSDSEMEMMETSPPKKRAMDKLGCPERMDTSSSNDENKDSSNILKKSSSVSSNVSKRVTALLSSQKTLCDDILENMLDLESVHRSFTPDAKFLKYVTIDFPPSLTHVLTQTHKNKKQIQKRYRGVVDGHLQGNEMSKSHSVHGREVLGQSPSEYKGG